MESIEETDTIQEQHKHLLYVRIGRRIAGFERSKSRLSDADEALTGRCRRIDRVALQRSDFGTPFASQPLKGFVGLERRLSSLLGQGFGDCGANAFQEKWQTFRS